MIKMKISLFWSIISFLFFFVSFQLILISECRGEEMINTQERFSALNDIPDNCWKKLAQQKIFFGHQSVGFNILDGIKDIMREYPQIKLNIVETRDVAGFNSPFFAHSRIGKNKKPLSKIEDFVNLIDHGIGDKADYSIMKLCYIDVEVQTDVDEIFETYKNNIISMQVKYPKLTFIHSTIPLFMQNKSLIAGAKSFVKRVLGKPLRYAEANNKRVELNELIRKEYAGKEPIFDIAKIESSLSNGKRISYKSGERITYGLLPDYTNDGGHLNEKGRKFVAEQFLINLACLTTKPTTN